MHHRNVHRLTVSIVDQRTSKCMESILFTCRLLHTSTSPDRKQNTLHLETKSDTGNERNDILPDIDLLSAQGKQALAKTKENNTVGQDIPMAIKQQYWLIWDKCIWIWVFS